MPFLSKVYGERDHNLENQFAYYEGQDVVPPY